MPAATEAYDDRRGITPTFGLEYDTCGAPGKPWERLVMTGLGHAAKGAALSAVVNFLGFIV